MYKIVGGLEDVEIDIKVVEVIPNAITHTYP